MALGFWQFPPWMVAGDFIYQWQISNADVTLLWIGLFAAAFTITRLFCRFMQLYLLRGVPIRD